MDAKFFNSLNSSSSQVTWREILTHIQTGFLYIGEGRRAETNTVRWRPEKKKL